MRNILAIIFIAFVTKASAEDVWFCQGDNLYDFTTEDRKMKSYIPQNFKFRVNRDTYKVYFGSGGYFNDVVLDLSAYTYDLLDNGHLSAGDNTSKLEMWDKGNFNYANVLHNSIIIITAQCDKF